MSIKEQIVADIKTAMKARDKLKTSTLRMILSEIKYAQAAGNIHVELSEADAMAVVSTYHKRLEKSTLDYPDGEMKDKIIAEIQIVSEYLPQKIGEAETQRVIDLVLAETQESNFGVAMKLVLAKLGSGADGKLVSTLLKASLAKNA